MCRKIFLILSIILSPLLLLADPGEPCGDNDPTGMNPCPLDTYVWVLAIAALILGAVYLYKQQKAQSRT